MKKMTQWMVVGIMIMVLAACSSQAVPEVEETETAVASQTNETVVEKNEEEADEVKEVEEVSDESSLTILNEFTLDAGEIVTIYQLGELKIHAVSTGDALNDEYFIVENEEALVGIELPSFTAHLNDWETYAESLSKPMEGIFVANHATGKSYVEGLRILGTEGAKEAIATGSTYATTQSLAGVFGEEFHGGEDMVQITDVIEPGPLVVGGIDFEVIDDGDNFSIIIPEANVIYTHMLGKSTHSILPTMAYIDFMTETLVGYQNADYALILSAHSEPEGQDAVSAKLEYLSTTKQYVIENEAMVDFIEAMKNTYPEYDGVNYLEMTAGFLYQ